MGEKGGKKGDRRSRIVSLRLRRTGKNEAGKRAVFVCGGGKGSVPVGRTQREKGMMKRGSSVFHHARKQERK